MNMVHALVLGIVEGITEFLPVSSTGHLILASRLLALTQTDFLKSFEIIIQLGAILAVVLLYWRSLLLNTEILKRVLVAFIPAAVIGFVFYKMIKKIFMGNEMVVVWSLILGGIILIVFELLHKERLDAQDDIAKIPYSKAFGIGLFQALAMIPGVSRSGATIVGGLTLGLKRKTIVEFSFLLAIPTMLAATALDLLKNASAFSKDQFGFLAVGFIVSFVVAIAAVKFLLNYIQKNNFIPFGIYRIIAGIAFWLLCLR